MKTKLILATMATILTSGAGAQTQPAPAKKVLVAYYSHSGNTREVAARSARGFGRRTLRDRPRHALSFGLPDGGRSGEKRDRSRSASRLEKPGRGYVAVRCDLHRFALLVGYRGASVATFLTSYDFAGKTVVPFMTHEGSRMGRSEEDIRKLCPKSQVPDGFLSAAVRWAVRKMPSKSGSVPV